MASATLANVRDEVELILSIPSSDGYVDSSQQLRDVNRAYEATAYARNWPHLLTRTGLIVVANVDRYPLPSNFRKAHHVKVLGARYDETELDILKKSHNKYAIDRDASQIILSKTLDTASPAYTLSNAESAGAAVTIELNTVSGLSQFDEIFVDSAAGTDEFTLVSSVGTLQITARLRAAKSAGDILYRINDIIDLFYYRNVTLLSASTDTMLIPDELDYAVAHHAAYLAYSRLEEYVKAKEQYNIWDDMVKRALLSQDQNSTGAVTTFTL